MSAASQFVTAVNAFVEANKELVLGAGPPAWQPARDAGCLRLKLPLEIGGIQLGQYLIIEAYTLHPSLRFSIGMLFYEHMICRLDYHLEVSHGNRFADGLPHVVVGPHWHSWELNRKTVSNVSGFLELPYATPYTQSRTLDSTLRWYCAERHISIGAHEIEFPPRGTLL